MKNFFALLGSAASIGLVGLVLFGVIGGAVGLFLGAVVIYATRKNRTQVPGQPEAGPTEGTKDSQ